MPNARKKTDKAIENSKTPTKDKMNNEQLRVKTNITWANPEKQQTVNDIQEQVEERRQDLIEEIKRIRNTPKANGKFPTIREIASMYGGLISRTTIGDILNDKVNAKYIARRPSLLQEQNKK